MLKDSEIPYQPLILGSLVINSQIYLKNCIIKYRQILQYKKNLVLNSSKIVSLQNESSQSMMNFVEQARDAPLDMFQVSWVDYQSIKHQKRQNSLSDNELLDMPNRRSHSQQIEKFGLSLAYGNNALNGSSNFDLIQQKYKHSLLEI